MTQLRRGFTLAPGERCLVVEGVTTTGGSTREVVQCVETHRGTVVGVGSLIDRSGGTAAFTVKRGPGHGDGRDLRAGRLPAVPGRQSGRQARQPHLTAAALPPVR